MRPRKGKPKDSGPLAVRRARAYVMRSYITYRENTVTRATVINAAGEIRSDPSASTRSCARSSSCIAPTNLWNAALYAQGSSVVAIVFATQSSVARGTWKATCASLASARLTRVSPGPVRRDTRWAEGPSGAARGRTARPWPTQGSATQGSGGAAAAEAQDGQICAQRRWVQVPAQVRAALTLSVRPLIARPFTSRGSAESLEGAAFLTKTRTALITP
eukprot:scaffold266_cov391-Prasinococcus_capsulatus_cf.AAC.25